MKVRRVISVTAAGVAAVVVFLLATLPPSPFRVPLDGVDADLSARTLAGAYHIHTTRSDGAGSKAMVAAAAARAGLAFVILTDHGDATRPPDAPEYVGGVLCLDAVEISTGGGHYVALGLPASPYPLGGEASAVVEDVRRLGGFGIAAHPDHPNEQLAWIDWEASIDGLEWINADSEWRDESAVALARVVLDYTVRPGPALASVFDRPERTLTRWDGLNQARRVVALAAVDAHGGGRPGSPADDEPRAVVGPSYDASFRTLSNRVVVDRRPTGNAAEDARARLEAIRRGAVYTVVDAISPDVLVHLDPGGSRVQSPLPEGARADVVSRGEGHRLEVHASQAPGHPPVPWVLTNWVDHRRPPVPEAIGPARVTSGPPAVLAWRVENDPASSGRLSVEAGAVTVRYTLGEGSRGNQFVAAVSDLTEAAGFDALVFRGRAAKPMRLSAQLRFPPDDRRWVKSVYIDSEERELVVPVGQMLAADRNGARLPDPATARSLLFVADLVNAKPGSSGEFTITDVRFRR
jgi:hypothetical protein